MGRPPRNDPPEVCRVIALHSEPVITAADINDALGLTPRGALNRLQTLAEDGYLHQKKIGSSGMVFWLTDAGKEALNEVFD